MKPVLIVTTIAASCCVFLYSCFLGKLFRISLKLAYCSLGYFVSKKKRSGGFQRRAQCLPPKRAKNNKSQRSQEAKRPRKQKPQKPEKPQKPQKPRSQTKKQAKKCKKSYSSTKMPNTSKHQMIGYGWIPPAGVEQVSLIKSPRSTQPVTPTPSSCGKSMKATWFLEQS